MSKKHMGSSIDDFLKEEGISNARLQRRESIEERLLLSQERVLLCGRRRRA